jgi:peroxiredoxin
VNIGLSHETRKQEKLSKWIIINYTKMVTHHDYEKKKGPCLKQTGASYIILSWLKKQKKGTLLHRYRNENTSLCISFYKPLRLKKKSFSQNSTILSNSSTVPAKRKKISIKLKTKLLYDNKDDVLQFYNNYQCTMNSWKNKKPTKL